MDQKKASVAKQARDAHGHFIKKDAAAPAASSPKRHTTTTSTAPAAPPSQAGQPPKKRGFGLRFGRLLVIMVLLLLLIHAGTLMTKHVLCDNGVQTQVGGFKLLQSTATKGDMWSHLHKTLWKKDEMRATNTTDENKRAIIFTPAKVAIQLVTGKDVKLDAFTEKTVFVTGRYNSCNQTIHVANPQDIEVAQ